MNKSKKLTNNEQKIQIAAVSLSLISIIETIIFVYYIVQFQMLKSGQYLLSPGPILMLGSAFFLLTLSLWLYFFARKKTNETIGWWHKLGEHPTLIAIKDLIILLVLNTIGFTVLLSIKPHISPNDYLVKIFFIRVEQLYPFLLFVAFLSLNIFMLCFYLREKNFFSYFRIENKWLTAFFLFSLSFYIYLATSILLERLFTPKIAHFPELAEAFLNGKFYLENPTSTKDLSLYNGKYYVSFPPLAAILMVPMVHAWGVQSINTAFGNTLIAALGVAFIFLSIEQLRELGWSQIDRKYSILLAVFFGFGTVQYFMATSGPVYYISQTLSATIFSLTLWLALLYRKFDNIKSVLLHAITTGTIFSLVLFTRPNIGFAIFALIAIQYQKLADQKNFSWKILALWVLAFSSPLALSVFGLGWYNFVRFDSPFDFGYRYMLVVSPELIYNLQNFGQLHPQFIVKNIYDNFLRLPYWSTDCQKITPNPQGMSIFLVSPLFLYLYKSFIKKYWVIGIWTSVLMILMTHLLYFNSGALQFGYRFSLDFTPLLILLLAALVKNPWSILAFIFFGASLFNNFIGVLWISKNWCINW